MFYSDVYISITNIGEVITWQQIITGGYEKAIHVLFPKSYCSIFCGLMIRRRLCLFVHEEMWFINSGVAKSLRQRYCIMVDTGCCGTNLLQWISSASFVHPKTRALSSFLLSISRMTISTAIILRPHFGQK